MPGRKSKYQRSIEEARAFNEKHPSGTPVLFWPGIRPDNPERSITRGAAWALPGGNAVVKVQGRPGGIALSHIEVIPQQMTTRTPPSNAEQGSILTPR